MMLPQQEVVTAYAHGGGAADAVVELKRLLSQYPLVRVLSLDVYESRGPLSMMPHGASSGTVAVALIEAVDPSIAIQRPL